MQIKDVTKRRDNEIVIHYTDDDGNYQSLRAYPDDIIAWHKAAQQSVQRTAESGEASFEIRGEEPLKFKYQAHGRRR